MVNGSFLEMHKTPSILKVLKSPTQCFSNLFKPRPIFLANLSILCKTEFCGTPWGMLVCMLICSLNYDFFDSENCILLKN